MALPGNKQSYARKRKEKVHKRVYISKRTNLLLAVMNELMQNDVYDEFIETCLLYGMAYLNQKNKLSFAKWTDKLVLPNLDNVDVMLVDDDDER